MRSLLQISEIYEIKTISLRFKKNLPRSVFETWHIFFGGAKAHTEFERVRLQSVVRSLRTTDGKRTPSTSVMRAFAPPEKTLRRGLEHAWPYIYERAG